MTRKHFNAIAEELRDRKPIAPDDTDSDNWQLGRFDQWQMDCHSMANVCKRFNPGFDRERFLIACGYYTED